MKKQFTIQPVNAATNLTKPVAKLEFSNLLGLLKDKYGSCGVEPQFTGINKTVFSL